MNSTEDFSENQNLTVVEGEVVGFSGPDVNFTLNCTGTDDAQTKNISFLAQSAINSIFLPQQ